MKTRLSYNKNTSCKMKLKAIIATAIVAVFTFSTTGIFAQTSSAADDNTILVPIPEPPASITRLDERCNYILDHYWDNFDIRQALSAKKRFHNTMGQFFAFTPYATADTVHMAIDRLIANVGKAKPQYLLDLCLAAEPWVHGDTAEYASDELYFPFVKAVVENKKVKGPEKARIEAQYRIISNSSVGVDASAFSFVTPDGQQKTLADVNAPHIMLMFVDPECIDCRLAKARFTADYVIDALVKNDIIDIVAIYPGDPSDEAWVKESSESLPKEWIVGANPEADLIFDLPQMPTIYYLDGKHIIKVKNVAIDNVLSAFHSLIENAPAEAPAQGNGSTGESQQ